MDAGCTLDLGYIVDLGCGLVHPHRAVSAVAELFVGMFLCSTVFSLY